MTIYNLGDVTTNGSTHMTGTLQVDASATFGTGSSNIFFNSNGQMGVNIVPTTYNVDVNGTLNAQSLYVGGNPISVLTANPAIANGSIITQLTIGTPFTTYPSDDLMVNGNTHVVGTTTSGRFAGDGSLLSNINGNKVSQVALALQSYNVAGNFQPYITTCPNITSVGVLSSLTVSPGASALKAVTCTTLTASGNTTSAYFIGDGSALTNINGNNVSQVGTASLCYTVLNPFQPNITTCPSITSVGVLQSLAVAGSSNLATLSVSGTTTSGFFAGDGSLLTNLNVGASASANLCNYVTKPAQSNITSLGTLTGLNMIGTIYVAGTNSFGTQVLTMQNSTVANAWTVQMNGSSNASPGSLSILNGSLPSNPAITIQQSTGFVGIQKNLPQYTLDVGGSVRASALYGSLNGTVVQASQTSITSLGTLTGLTVSGVVTATSFAGDVVQPTQSNITALGNLTSLTVTGNVGVAGILTVSGACNLQGINSPGISVNSTNTIISGNLIVGGSSNCSTLNVLAASNLAASTVTTLRATGLSNLQGVVATTINASGTLSTSNILPGVGDNIATIGSSANRYQNIYSAGGVITTSDSRTKTSTPLTYGLADLLQVNTIKYRWNTQAALPDTDPTKNFHYYGVCADELVAVFPELCYSPVYDSAGNAVVNDTSTVPIQMNYCELIPVCINAIKELKAENDGLKAQLAAIHEILARNNMT